MIERIALRVARHRWPDAAVVEPTWWNGTSGLIAFHAMDDCDIWLGNVELFAAGEPWVVSEAGAE